MGAQDFAEFRKGQDLEKAFWRAVDDALDAHGSGGYTGTIAEKPSVTLRRPEPMSLDAAKRFAFGSGAAGDYGDVEKNEKWEEAFALRIADVGADGKPLEGFYFYGLASC